MKAFEYQEIMELLAEGGINDQIHGIPVRVRFDGERYFISDDVVDLYGVGNTMRMPARITGLLLKRLSSISRAMLTSWRLTSSSNKHSCVTSSSKAHPRSFSFQDHSYIKKRLSFLAGID